jgi:predicted nucleic acid-binding protein
MHGVIVDTDIAIDFLRGDQSSHDLIAPLWKANRAHLSVISIYELYAGMRPKEKDATDAFIEACIVEPVTPETARTAGELFRHSRQKGLTLGSVDCLILATAKVKGFRIATRNTKHYPAESVILHERKS